MSLSILDHIGNTPVVEIKRLNPNPRVRILAKLEYFNPGGSIKDRPALYMIREGERSGMLTHNKTVIEATSGNTGIGLALVCSIKGYRLLLAMSEAASEERKKILLARGAEILLTPGHLGTDGAIEEVYRLVRENPDKYFMADQYNNPANWLAHYEGTAAEIIDQAGPDLVMAIATMGTSGTLMGISRRLKEHDPAIQVVGVEPYLGHKIQGLKNMKEAYQPEIFEKKRIDRKVNIHDEDAFEMTRQLAKKEGLLVGMSSGAAMHVAVREASRLKKGTLVVIFPDGGERYLSTPLFAVKKKADFKIYNTLARKKDPFVPMVPGKVSMYSCGPTAYAPLSLGECRRFVFADLLARYLEFRGYSVKHVMNITDLDDKTIQGSEDAKMELTAFTRKHIERFEQTVKKLRIKAADCYPKASEHVQDMVEIAEKLVEKGFAYEKLKSIYFNISKIPDYGRLSGIDIDKVRVGATVDLDDYEKDNPKDFTLLKRSKLAELKRGIFVKTKWGNVRPSWHIQCAAMSMKYLGESFDIHTSGRELVFPHHENEIAIAAALTGRPLARYWVHCERVLLEGKNIDESDRLSVEDLFENGFSGREIRYWLMGTHFRKPLSFSENRLLNAKKALNRLDTCIHTLLNIRGSEKTGDIDQLLYDIRRQFTEAMDDDLNVPAAIAAIFTHVKRINSMIQENGICREDARRILDLFSEIDKVLMVLDIDDSFFDPQVQELIKKRDEARRRRDFEQADLIREELRKKGILLMDRKLSD